MVQVSFPLGSRSLTVYGLTQYDYGQELEVHGLPLPAVVECQISLQRVGGTTESLAGVVVDDTLTLAIPDTYLAQDTESDYTIYVYIYVTTESSGTTVYLVSLPVTARSMPDGYVPGETSPFAAVIEEITELVEEAQGAATLSESYAKGGTGTRTGEDTDNSKYYSEEARDAETGAADSAAEARASEVAAAGSASTAAAASTSAAEAKTAAEAAMVTATAKATEAANSASAAGVSAAAASASETAAGAYASTAGASAVSAASSASAAESSATSAASSASSADSSATAAAAALEDVTDAKQDALAAISGAQTTAVGAVTAEGTRQVGLVTAEGTTQKNAVQAKGTEVIASIPSDYTALRNSVSSLKSDLNAYVSNLIIDFTWMSGKSFNINTGAIKTQPGYNASYPIIGDDFFSQFNSNALNGSASDVICLWNDDSYVGYFFHLKYYNPSGTEITKPTYNRWAFSVGDSRINTFHLRTVAYQDEVDNITNEVDNITNAVTLIAVETEQLINSFEWSAGYYSFTGGTPEGGISSYHRTNKLHGTQYEFDNPTIFNGSSYNYISFWLQTVYVGYYLDGKYYDPSRTEVTSVTYDEWAANIYTNNYEQLLPNSLGNRVDKLETEFRPSPLQGKKLGCIGDSIAAGAGYAGGYGGIIASDYEMTIDNNATNGSVLVPQQSLSTIIPQLNNLDNDCDYVILEGGFNDSWLGSTIGEYSASYSEPTADNTFYGNLNYLLYTAVHKYAGKKMCFLIVHAGKQEYSCMNNTYPYYEATVKLCKKWGIPVVDLNQNCVPFGLLPVSDDIRTAYTANSGDGVHPNEDGYRKYYVPLIVAMLEAL